MANVGRLLVRADAHSAIGAGHVMRCLALAHAWREARGAVTFVTYCDSDALLARLRAGCDEVVRLERPFAPETADADRAQLLGAGEAYARAPVVIDGYGFDATYHRAVRARGHVVLVVDDNALLPEYDADWILNQNVFATAEMYLPARVTATLLVGPSYALLRGEFARYRTWAREARASARHVLVTLGGSDPANVTLDVLRGVGVAAGLGRLATDVRVRVISGPSNPHLASLTAFASSAPFACEVLEAVDDMPTQMEWADVAVSAAGSTCWELAFMGLPSLLITVADNQGRNAEVLAAHGVALDVGAPDGGLGARVARALEELSADNARRAEMARRGRLLVDGKGAPRVAATIAEGR